MLTLQTRSTSCFRLISGDNDDLMKTQSVSRLLPLLPSTLPLLPPPPLPPPLLPHPRSFPSSPPVEVANSLALVGLDRLERTFPILNQSSEEVVALFC